MATAADCKGFFFTKTRHRDTYPAIDPSKRDFSGRYVFITGASKGLGREMALSYASAGAAGIGIGARTDLAGLLEPLAEAARAAGHAEPQVVAVQMDVTDETSVTAAAAAVGKAFPRLDVLVNNAGYLELREKIGDVDPAEWWKTMTVNLLGPFLVTRAFLPLLLGRGAGGDRTIVNLTSIAAHFITPRGSAYQTSKLALLRLTEFFDADYGASDGLLAYALHPGGILTDMGQRLPKERQPALIDTAKLPADVVVFLTEKRREWLAGRYVSATWDMEELLSREQEIVEGDKLKVRMIV